MGVKWQTYNVLCLEIKYTVSLSSLCDKPFNLPIIFLILRIIHALLVSIFLIIIIKGSSGCGLWAIFTTKSLKVYRGNGIGRLCLQNHRQVVLQYLKYMRLSCATLQLCVVVSLTQPQSYWIRISQVVPKHVLLKNFQMSFSRQVEKPCTGHEMFLFVFLFSFYFGVISDL